MLLGDPCTYVINITVYLMLLLLELKTCLKAFKEYFLSELIIINFQIKSLLLSHHHSTSALVSEILMSVLQTRGRPIIGADIKHFTDYRYRPF